MGRMYGQGKGRSRSAKPYKKSAPSWQKQSSEEVVESVCSMAKKGMTPSQIGVSLRDTMGIGQSRAVTSNRVLRVLKLNGLAPEVPEDLYHLIKKATSIRKHLDVYKKDKDAKFHLILVESRIHRLARYYKRTKQLVPNWKYKSSTAGALLQ